MKRRFPLSGRQTILATAVIVSLVGCSIRSSASGGAKGSGDADAKSSGKSESSASTSAKTKSKGSSSSTFRVTTSTSVKGSSKGSAKGSGSASGSSSGSASASGGTKGSASGSASASGKGSASGGGKIVFKTKPRAAHVSTRKTEKKFVGINLVAKIRAQGSLSVKGSGSGAVKGGGSTKPATKDPKPTTPDPKPTTPKDPKPTTPKDPKPTTPTTPTEPPPVVVDPPPVVVIDPPAEPPDNVFGYEDPVRGCFEGIVYPLSANAQALPTNYSALEPISVVYACEWDIPTREWSTGFPGIADHFEWFAIRYSGGFSVDVAGDWTFRISSDDGAKLLIDGKIVINNDGVHPPQEKSGTVTLSKGDHDMVLEYFQGPRYHINLQLYSTAPGGTEGIFSVR